MIKLGEMTDNEIWAEIEDCFYSIQKDVEHRCYSSMTGARYIQHLVRKNLIWIDRALLEIEVRAAKAGKEDNDEQCNNLLQYSEPVRRL